MKGFFRVDGKFHTVMSKILDLLLVSLLWAVGCIPVLTLLTSTASMYHTVVKCVRYDRGRVLPEFWEAYRKNLPQGMGLTALFGGVGAILTWLDYRTLVVHSGESLLLTMVLLAVSLLYILNLVWIVPVFSRFANTFGGILKLNYVIAVRNVLRTVPMLLVTGAAAVLFLAVNETVFFAPAVVMLLHSYLAEPAMHRYMPPQAEQKDWRYGDR